jgi:zinc transport system ATP-binding protein
VTETSVLDLRDAVVGYEGRPILHAATMTVRAGEVVAILGPNGSGKSTLVRGVLGLAQLQHGSITAFGEPIGHLRNRWRLGYVPQQHTLTAGVPTTVHEVVSSGRLSRSRPWRRATTADREAVGAAIAALGLADHERSLVADLSGGQQRRVLVARALASDAQLLILDEPTAGVDLENQEALAQAMGRLAAASITIVLVAHDLGPAAPVITRVVTLEDGRIVYDGPPSAGHHGHDHHHVEEPAASNPFGIGS